MLSRHLLVSPRQVAPAAIVAVVDFQGLFVGSRCILVAAQNVVDRPQIGNGIIARHYRRRLFEHPGRLVVTFLCVIDSAQLVVRTGVVGSQFDDALELFFCLGIPPHSEVKLS